jgi:hypothetical protein
MLFSNDLSNPEISVPISVTANIPITTPNAVRSDRILFAKTDETEIYKFSKKSENIRTVWKYLL